MSSNAGIQIDSNSTFLRFSEEASKCVLESSPVWYDMEPNSYGDFGGEITTQPRAPINEGRQRKKGQAVDKDVTANWTQDVTVDNIQRLLRGHFVADYTERADTKGFTRTDAGTTITITNVDGINDEFDAASGLDSFDVGSLVLASGFTNSANNGLHVVDSAAATALGVTSTLVDETPPAAARITGVGFQFGSGEVDIDVSGDFPKLVRASGSKDLTDFGLQVGEPVYIGGDTAGTSFANAENNGRKRVRSVSATEIVFDKSDEDMTAETGSGLTVQLFLPSRTIKNEASSSDRVRRFYQFERGLGSSTGDSNLQAQYAIGCFPSTLAMTLEIGSVVTTELGYVGLESTVLNANNLPASFDNTSPAVTADDIKSLSSNLGSSIVPVVEGDAFNTSSDLTRIRMALVSSTDEAPTPLTGFLQSLTLNVDQSAEASKALGVFGGFDVSLGDFEVEVEVTGYFSDVAAITAVEEAQDVTVDFWQVKNNVGMVIDLPLVTVSDGRPNVEQNSPITIPLNSSAATGASITPGLNHTMMLSIFDYLPEAADV